MRDYEKFDLPKNEGWCAIWFDGKNRQHVIPNSYTKSKGKARRIADEYMLINQVKTDITECMF